MLKKKKIITFYYNTLRKLKKINLNFYENT